MKFSLLFLIGLGCAIAFTEATDEPTKASTEKATTKAPTTKPTTSKPTTSKPTTSKPTTSKPTTSKPTTSKPTTSKPTTSKPKTSKPTTKAPTKKPVTVGPPPPPKQPTFKAAEYSLIDQTSKKPCILFVAALQFSFNYTMKGKNGSTVLAPHHQNLTNATSLTNVTGQCPMNESAGVNQTRTISSLEISFNMTYTLLFDFVLENGTWYVNTTSVTIDLSMLPNSAETDKLTGFNVTYKPQKVPDNEYMICNAVVKTNLKTSAKTGNISLSMKDLELEPFNVAGSGDFPKPRSRCDADYVTNNIVPIAVGCALAALVLVVLIAYLIGRSRNSKTGYQSV